jgi:hypothetical protein
VNRSFFSARKPLSLGEAPRGAESEAMRLVCLVMGILGAWALTGSSGDCVAKDLPFGKNHACVCVKLQGYLDFLNRSPLDMINSPVPENYGQRLLARGCGTTISPADYEQLITAIRAYVYYCSQASQRECLISRRAMRDLCPRMEIGFSVPPPPGARAQCYNACKANCPRARDPQGDWGDLAIDPRCLQHCSDACRESYAR